MTPDPSTCLSWLNHKGWIVIWPNGPHSDRVTLRVKRDPERRRIRFTSIQQAYRRLGGPV